MQSLSARSAYGDISAIRADEPEIDPRRKDPPSPSSPPGPGRFMPLPTVGAGDDKMDVLSRLLKDRILLLGQQVDDEVANVLVAQLLYLANEDAQKDMTLYINSPGGSVSAGMAIFDTMNYVPCDVNTVCFGTAASMGAFLLGAGTKGKRRSLPNSRIMIHQPLGGAQGQAHPAPSARARGLEAARGRGRASSPAAPLPPPRRPALLSGAGGGHRDPGQGDPLHPRAAV